MKKLILILIICFFVIPGFSQHFKKGFTGSGADHMLLLVAGAEINGVPLQAGDEIAVFDGNLCCGVYVLTQPIDPGDTRTFVELNANPDDGLDGSISDGSPNGFAEGNKVYLRFWDSDPGVEYHNVIVQFYDTGKNPISAQAFQESSTAYITASTANTTKTFTGIVAGLWNFDLNWSPNGVPEPNSDVVVPSVANQPTIYPTDKAYCGSLTFQNNPTLIFKSDGSATGSLIVTNNISGNATVNTERYMTGNKWHLVSSPVSGQSIAAFLGANSSIPTNLSSRGMMEYNVTENNWSSFFTNSTGGDISLGKGFCIRTNADVNVSFSGSLSNGNVTASVSNGGFGWNLVGNPFTSAMYVRQDVFGFLVQNDALLDPSFKALYLWDPMANAGSGGYSEVNFVVGQPNLASGQGFFIKAASSGNVTFTKQMQVHQTGAPFKSATITWPSVLLNAKASDISSSTKILFNEKMTLGLDPGYDAGLLRSGNGFDIYSRLVNDNGVDFAIQTLPGKQSDSYIIPIGVDTGKGGEIVFSSQVLNLPLGYQVILEDKLTNTHTDITDVTARYVSNLKSGSKGIGRFYLHVGTSLQTGIMEIQQDNILVYTIGQTVYIKGNVSNKARFAIYSVDGRLMNRFGPKSQNLNQMSVAGYTPGIYFIKVQDEHSYKSIKFIVGN